MSACAIWSASITAAPSAANISPTTDFPEEMPPVKPTFSNPASLISQKNCPRHRERPKARDFRRESGAGKFRDRIAPAQFCRAHGVCHQHCNGQRPYAARDGCNRACYLGHLGMDIADQGEPFRPKAFFAFRITSKKPGKLGWVGHSIHYYVDDSGAWFYKIARDHPCPADGRNQNVDSPTNTRKIASFRMTNGHRGIGIGQ